MPKLFYLAGPINACTDEEANKWRDECKSNLGHAFEFLDPMARDYRGSESQNAAAIVEGDLRDISSVNAIIVNAERPSWGTAMELSYAYYVAKKPIYAVCSSDKPSPWLAYHTTLFKTWAELYTVLLQAV